MSEKIETIQFTLTSEEVITMVSALEYSILKHTEWKTFNEHRLEECDKKVVKRIIDKETNLLSRIRKCQYEQTV